jgi:cyclic pyranopterin phosphate synthase
MPKDAYNRTIDYLRISVTDRCNLRCTYCMPEQGIAQKPHDAMLTLEEIAHFVRVAADAGFKHIRLTGGEPLVRLGIVDLVRAIHETPGIESIAMTTNGLLLPRYAAELKAAGLDRVNISLDTLDAQQYRQITRLGEVADAEAGIQAALASGLTPVKVNVVAIRSLHQDFQALTGLSQNAPIHVRFIEFMAVGDTEGTHSAGTHWELDDTIPSDELRQMIAGLEPTQENPDGWGPARYYRLPGAQGTVGFISANSNHFCKECNRVRLTADGLLRPCLFSDSEFDVRTPLRHGSDADVRAVLDEALRQKPDEHHDRVGTQRQMFQIGG